MATVELFKKKIAFQGNEYDFSNKFCAPMLRLLYEAYLRQESLSFIELERYLQQHSTIGALQRTQIRRMVEEIERAIADLGLPFSLDYPNRKKTVGCWQLIPKAKFKLVSSQEAPRKISAQMPEMHPLFECNRKGNADPMLFHNFLEQWISSYFCIDNGILDLAEQDLLQLKNYPLTIFGKQLVRLYQARLAHYREKFDDVENVLNQIIQDDKLNNSCPIKSLAKVLQYKNYYHISPHKHYNELLNLHTAPDKFLQADPIALMEWHNMHSFLLKRRLQQTKSQKVRVELHNEILLHLQEALVFCIMLENRHRLLDVGMNYSLYLQTAFNYNLVDIELVLDWYELCHNYADKFSLGDYSMWSDLFFTEFYQDHEQKLVDKKADYRIHFPDHKKYYLIRWDKIINTENTYLKVVYLFCYFRFLSNEKNPDINELRYICNIAIHYLNMNKKVKKELLSDRYRDIIDEIYYYEDKLIYQSINIDKLLLPYQSPKKER